MLSSGLLWVVVGGGVLLAFSDWQNSNPSEWSGEDVYHILNNSPWSKTGKVKASAQSSGAYRDDAPVNGAPSAPAPVGMGGGRRMGGVGYGGGGRGSGGSRPSSAPNSTPSNQPAEVTVQWQSALPVRLAAAKKSGGSVDVASYKTLDHYVIAVIGVPMTYLGGRAASADSAETNSDEEERRLQERLKSSTSLVRSGHDALAPTKVEMNQGADGRILFYFAKTDPITAKDKTVEFRISLGSMDLRRKFVVKDMEYQGKLEI